MDHKTIKHEVSHMRDLLKALEGLAKGNDAEGVELAASEIEATAGAITAAMQIEGITEEWIDFVKRQDDKTIAVAVQSARDTLEANA